MRTVALAVFLVTGAVTLQLPLYADYARDAGLGAGAKSLLQQGYVAALPLSFVLLAGVSDRFGRRPIVVLALVAALAATLFVVAVPSAWGLGGARWLQGLGVALCMGAATAWMAERADPQQAARVTGWTRVPPGPGDRTVGVIGPPDSPAGSLLPAAAIGVGWGVSGIVVAVLPGVLAQVGIGEAAAPALFAMLIGGFVAQLHAR